MPPSSPPPSGFLLLNTSERSPAELEGRGSTIASQSPWAQAQCGSPPAARLSETPCASGRAGAAEAKAGASSAAALAAIAAKRILPALRTAIPICSSRRMPALTIGTKPQQSRKVASARSPRGRRVHPPRLLDALRKPLGAAPGRERRADREVADGPLAPHREAAGS